MRLSAKNSLGETRVRFVYSKKIPRSQAGSDVAGSAMIRLLCASVTAPASVATLLCIAAGLVHPTPAAAEDLLTWGGSLSLTSDYVYRGLSQSEGQPAVQCS